DGFAAVDRADAGRRSSGDLCDRQCGRGQRGAVRGRAARGRRRQRGRRRTRRVPQAPDRGGRRQRPPATVTTVGSLRGGQLARRMALAGAPLGLRFSVMDTSAEACAGQFAPLVVGDYRDAAALAEFASGIDIATFDFENVPAASAQWLSERVPMFPNPRALATSQDRLAEKTLFV